MEATQKRPRVSVCVVTWNHEMYISDCLLSVVTQRFDGELEILVGDDGSKDQTGEIVQQIASKYPGLITYFRHEVNLGVSGNRRFLIEHSSGDFIAHLDGDDFWLPGKLESQLDFLRQHPECAAVFTNAIVVNEQKELLGVFNNWHREIFDTEYLLRKGNHLNHSSLLYRASLRTEILSTGKRLFDYHSYLRLSTRGKLGFVNQSLVVYRTGMPTALTKSVSRELHWQVLMDMKPRVTNAEAFYGGLAFFWGKTVQNILLQGDLKNTRQLWRQIRAEAPSHSVGIMLKGIGQVIRTIWNGAIRRICCWVSGNRLRVYYRR